MNQTPRIGDNRTGGGAAPQRAQEMKEVPEELAGPTSRGNRDAAALHTEYSKEGIRTGSIPRSGAAGEAVAESLAPLIDKMGARLGFERTGTRFYDGLLAKCDAQGSYDGGPTRDELVEIREQEREHFIMLRQAILEVGGDPTAVTPSASLEATVGKGAGDVIGDPRTSLLEGLEAILVAELADHENWEGLIELAEMQGKQELAERFRVALSTEEEHVEKVRAWVAAGQGRRPTRH